MLEATHVAVVGASARPGTVGHHVVRHLREGGFGGALTLVNPRYDEVEGLECVPTLAKPVDLAVLAVSNELLMQQVGVAVEAGARSLAIFASCHGETPEGRPLVEAIATTVAAAGLPVCGGNGMGFVNVERSLRVCGFHQPWGLRSGGVAFLTHSGSIFSAMLHNHRSLDFNLVVSTGNELATGLDDYLAYAVNLDSTSVVGMFLETVRRPEAMSAALTQAAERGLPVVALKVGRNERSKAAVATHSAAIAGEYAAFEAFAADHGVHLVDTMEEMADTLAVFSGGRRAGGGRLGSVHDSGGERSLLIDTAERVGVPLSDIGEATASRLEAVLDPGLEPQNPVDAWGTGREASEVFREAALALADDSDVAVLALSVDLTAEENEDEAWTPVILDIAASTPKPVVVLANLAPAVDATQERRLIDAGIPVLRGTESGLVAIKHLLHHRKRPRGQRIPDAQPIRSRWLGALTTGAALGDEAALELMADFGLPVIDTRRAGSEDEAVAAAAAFGVAVALKTRSGLAHKSEADGVELGLRGEGDVRAAYRRLSRLGPDVLVQKMAPSGVEVALGIVRDPTHGPMVVIAAGGVLVEFFDDRVVALPPITAHRAGELIDRLRIRPLLDGVRGSPARDVGALVDTVVALGELARSMADEIDSVDVNPVVVHSDGCVVVDALVLARTRR